MRPGGCPRCLAVFVDLEADTRYLHRNPLDLLEGLADRCWFCLKVFDVLKSSINDQTLEPADFERRYADFQTTFSPDDGMFYVQFISASLQLNQSPDALWPHEDFGCVFNFSDKDDDLPPISRPELENTTQSRSSVAFIAGQIKKFQDQHSTCQSSSKAWYPTRLLKLRLSGETTLIKLVETTEEQMTGSYATLSHCWGGKVPLRLLVKNREQFKAAIPSSDIPRLYMDAAKVALDVGVEYIWIDSLCIIQDSRQDWRQESARMGDVYQHGLFNIEATFQKNCSESLFSSRDPNLLFPHETRGPDGKHLVWTENDDSFWASGRSTPEDALYGRGWVFQERVLSRRSVTYTRRQIFYRCGQDQTSEMEGLSHFPPEHRQGYTVPELLLSTAITPDNYQREWMRVLADYNYTALSFPGDKLIALSGVAQMFGRIRKSRYLAGLWEDALLHDLMWMRLGKSGRTNKYRAPTWSWASVDSFECRAAREATSRCPCPACFAWRPQIIEASTSPIGPDEYGKIAGGSIKMNAFVYPVFRGQKIGASQGPASSARDAWESRIKAALKNMLPDFHTWGHEICVTLDYDETMTGSEPALKECFAMLVNDEASHGRSHEINLLLLAASTPAWGTYQRIGVCKIIGSDSLGFMGVSTKGDSRSLGQPNVEGVCQRDGRMVLAFISGMEDKGIEVPAHQNDVHGTCTITIV